MMTYVVSISSSTQLLFTEVVIVRYIKRLDLSRYYCTDTLLIVSGIDDAFGLILQSKVRKI